MAGYPDLAIIPFNSACVRDCFVPYQPPATRSSGPGFWGIIQGDNMVLVDSGGQFQLPEGKLPEWLAPAQEPLCIGLWKGRPLRIFTIKDHNPLLSPFVTEALNAPVQKIDDATLSIGGLAKQILNWERQTRFCSDCGGFTKRAASGWSKRCIGCGTRYFPHLAPCAIVLVMRGREVLLIRKAEWTDGRYSLVAGFLEFGESLEECAAREVREETGIKISDIRYVGSQNWPFPSQLMAGFVARYAGGDIIVNRDELEDARWFSIDDLPTLAPRRSIARRIIDTFCR